MLSTVVLVSGRVALTNEIERVDNGAGSCERIDVVLLAPGTYYILADAYYTDDSGSYDLTVTCGSSVTSEGGHRLMCMWRYISYHIFCFELDELPKC